jgi:branched-chain amino acid transport system substrate-binding protein
MDSNDITRRRVISTLGAAGAVGLAGCGGGGDGTTTNGGSGPDEISIGMVQPLSGSLQAYGKIAMRGFYTYFGYRGADIPGSISEGTEEFDVDGTTYSVEVRDSGGDQTEAQNAASDMAGDVTALAGGTSSASALAIANNVANQQGIPYMAGPAASVSITGSSDNCSEAVFRASETVAMDAQSGGKYIADETDISSVYIYYANYSFGESVRNNYKRVLENNGVTVAGQQALPPGYSEDWPGQFDQATNAGVDAVIGGFTVATLPAMLGTFLANDYDFRFAGGMGTRLSAAALGATLAGSLDELTEESIRQSGLGPLTTRYHWNQYDNQVNTDANEVHRDNYGTNADLFTSGMFTGASAIVQAVESAGSGQPTDIVNELTGMSVSDTMKGEGGYEFQEYNNQARSAMTVVDLAPTQNDEFWDAPVQPTAPLQTYGKDETTLSEDNTTCSLN